MDALSKDLNEAVPPTLTDEQLQFFKYLQNLQSTNPALFQETINALDSQDDSNTQVNEALTQLVKSMTSQNADGSLTSITLPGGKKVMGESGVEDRVDGIYISPGPGFSLKTKDSNDSKVFINICIHDEIGVPGMTKKLDANGEPVEGMNIPMSIGPKRLGADKTGVACIIYDVIVHPNVMKEAVEDATGRYRDFICQLGIQSVEQKYSLSLDKRYKLPKLKYMGDIEKQFIRDSKKKPKIEEISEPTPTKSTTAKPKTKKTTEIESISPDIDMIYYLAWIHAVTNDSHDARGTSDSSHSKGCSDTIHSTGEYADPLLVPDGSHTAIEFVAELEGRTDPSVFIINMSAFKLMVKIPGYNPVSIYYPCAVAPATAASTLVKPPGSATRTQLHIKVDVDRSPWGKSADPGSKAWLIAKALGEGSDGDGSGLAGNPYAENPPGLVGRSGATSGEPDKRAAAAAAATAGDLDDELLPEDRFHIRLPRNVDKYTGLSLGEDDSSTGEEVDTIAAREKLEDTDLPEDRFHRKDAASSYIINQREQAIKDKWAKHEKEKEDRKNDPNVEYVDMDDFKPGGKFGPKPAAPIEEAVEQSQASMELQKASAVLRNFAPQDDVHGLDLTSNLWTELLD